MNITSTVSSRYRVVIPKEVRDRMGIKPGQKVMFVELGDAVCFTQVIDFEDLEGTMRGVENDFDREAEWADEERARLLDEI